MEVLITPPYMASVYEGLVYEILNDESPLEALTVDLLQADGSIDRAMTINLDIDEDDHSVVDLAGICKRSFRKQSAARTHPRASFDYNLCGSYKTPLGSEVKWFTRGIQQWGQEVALDEEPPQLLTSTPLVIYENYPLDVAVFAGGTQATVTIYGAVTDSTSGDGISGVDVVIKDPEGKVIAEPRTTEDGSFRGVWSIRRSDYEALRAIAGPKTGTSGITWAPTQGRLNGYNTSVISFTVTDSTVDTSIASFSPGGDDGIVLAITGGQFGYYPTPNPSSGFTPIAPVNSGTTYMAAVTPSSVYLMNNSVANTGVTANTAIFTLGGTYSSPSDTIVIHSAKFYTGILTDTEIYRAMLDIEDTSSTSFYPEDITTGIWPSRGETSLSLIANPGSNPLYYSESGIRATFMKEGYLDEVKYIPLPNFEVASVAGIEINATLGAGEISTEPTSFSFMADGTSLPLLINTPFALDGIFSIDPWVSVSGVEQESPTQWYADVDVLSNSGRPRSSRVIALTGNRRVEVPVDQEGVNIVGTLDTYVGNLAGKTIRFNRQDQAVNMSDVNLPLYTSEAGITGIAGYMQCVDNRIVMKTSSSSGAAGTTIYNPDLSPSWLQQTFTFPNTALQGDFWKVGVLTNPSRGWIWEYADVIE